MSTVTVRAHKRRKPKSKMCEEMTLRLREEVLGEWLARELAIALRGVVFSEPEMRAA